MSSCPEQYELLTNVCVPISWKLTPDEVVALRAKLVKIVMLVLPDRIPQNLRDQPPNA